MILTKQNIESVNLDLLIEDKIKTRKQNELLRIVPTNRKIRTLKREMILSAPDGTIDKINLETIGTFSTKILLTSENSKVRVLSESASAALMKQSFQETELKYFSDYGDDIPIGTLDRIRNVISEYKKHGITPAVLKKEAEQLSSSEKLKALDIAGIYENYNSKCASLFVKEIGDIYSAVVNLSQDEFEEKFRSLFPDAELIIVSGFDEFTVPEINILNMLSEIKYSRMFLSFDYYQFNPLIFSHLDPCYKKLKGKGFKGIKDLSTGTVKNFSVMIKKRLFKPGNKINEEYKNSITVIEALNREREIENIAKEIKTLLNENNVKPNTICVSFNLIQNYSSLIRDIFNLYGLPFNLTDRYSLKTSAPVITLINFLEILENDFYYKNIFRALSSGFLNFSGIDQSVLLKASVNLKIISGYENWLSSLNDAVRRCGSSEEESSPSLLDMEIYEKALSDIKLLYDHLKPFNGQMTLEQFRGRFLDLIFSINLPRKLINGRISGAEENLKAVNTFIEEINEVFELLEMEYDKNKKFPLIFFLNNLRTVISSSRYNIKEKPGYGIQVTTINEIRGLSFDYLFVAGLCDGDMPTRYTPEIFFSGSFARNERIHQTEERYHFYQSLCSWNKHLFLTYSRQEERKELIKSNLLSDFLSLFSTENKNEESYAGTIYSREDLYINIGRLGIEKSRRNYGNALSTAELQRMERSLEVNNIRLNYPFGESEFTGFIGNNLSENAKENLDEYKDRQYSITQLETYAKCPYKYFAERVLRLKPVSEPTEEIEALEMGSLLHSILYKFYSEIKEKKISVAGTSGEGFNRITEMLFKIAEENVEKAGFNSPLNFFEKEKILGINGDRKNSILYQFLVAERDNDDGYIPEFFEIGFGDSSDEKSGYVNIKSGSAALSGKIDRIDVKSEAGKYKVVDYKLSGKKPSMQELTNGISLQLPLYMYAAKVLIKAQLGAEMFPAGAEIYSLKYDIDNFGKKTATYRSRKKISDEAKEEEAAEKNRELINICLQTIEKYVNEIKEGKFNLSTLPDREKTVCNYCDFRPVCRIQDVD